VNPNSRVPPLRKLYVSDTTLRDGDQMPGVHLSAEGKVEIAHALARAGVNSIELGFPASGPHEVESVQAIARTLRGPSLLALCRTSERDIDAAAEALSPAPAYQRVASLFVGTSDVHLLRKLALSREAVCELVSRTVAYAKSLFRTVSFTAEDASRTDVAYLADVYRSALDAGASVIGFADTVGILTPLGVVRALNDVRHRLGPIKGIAVAVHFHDDLGLATANTLAAVGVGVDIAQCTVNGIGERAGNAALEEVVLALSLHEDEFGRRTTVDTRQLNSLSAVVARLTGVAVQGHKSVVGSGVFTTGAGIHQDGLLKDPSTYLPFAPELVGSEGFKLLVTNKSGRAAVAARLDQMGIALSTTELDRVAREVRDSRDRAEGDALLQTALARVRSAGASIPPTNSPSGSGE
jgi:2-isopropylmalate synthase